jgi:choline dehydrogenase-like flavoprotein
MTVAHEFLNRGLKVLVLEAGGKGLEKKTQDLYKGEVTDKRHGDLDRYRHRRLGGTTTVWGGRCAPFDDVDFERRSHVAYSGWPIGRKELDPYYERAHEYLHLGAYSYDAREALPDAPPELIPGFPSAQVQSDRLWRFSLPTDFGKEYLQPLQASRNVTVCLHANALRLVTLREGGAVDYLLAGSLDGGMFRVRAKSFVLAMGGLETTRLLLVSNDVHAGGIGNQRDLLGRFYISHMTGDLGEATFTPKGGPVIWNYEQSPEGIYCKRALAIREQQQRMEGLLNFRAILSHPGAADPAHGNGVISAMYLVKRFLMHRIPPEYSKTLASGAALERVAAHCGNLVLDLPRVLSFSAMWTRKRLLSRRKFPSLAFASKSNTYTLHYDGEQSPNPESRVTLTRQKDEFGVPRLRVDWRCQSSDVESVIRSAQLIQASLEASGVGKFRFDPEERRPAVEDNGVGSHHMGTTRMASSPGWGVVDENCRVFGVDNLYVASSSTFPTSGCANPTLTIVALAVRIADRLKQEHERGSAQFASAVSVES